MSRQPPEVFIETLAARIERMRRRWEAQDRAFAELPVARFAIPEETSDMLGRPISTVVTDHRL